VAVGVATIVEMAVTVPGARVLVTVFVTDGVGMIGRSRR